MHLMQMHQSLSQTNHFESMLSFVKLTQSVIPVATAFMWIEKFRSGRKLGGVGASFSDISRPPTFSFSPMYSVRYRRCLICENFYFNSSFFKKERHALHLKNKLLSLFSLVSHRLFFTLIFCFIESQVLHAL